MCCVLMYFLRAAVRKHMITFDAFVEVMKKASLSKKNFFVQQIIKITDYSLMFAGTKPAGIRGITSVHAFRITAKRDSSEIEVFLF